MYTRIIEIAGVLDPIAVNITEEEDHELLDQVIIDMEEEGLVIELDETNEMPGSTRGLHITDALDKLNRLIGGVAYED